MAKKNDLEIGKQDFGGLAFLPLITFLAVYVGAGLIFSALGSENPFKQIPREAALTFGIVVALIMGKHTLDYKLDVFTKAAGDNGVLLMCLIFLFSGAFAGVAKAMGGVDSTVNLGLTFIPRQFIFAGVFIISAFIATAMGTSMGTIAAIGPVAMGLADKAAISPAIAIAAAVGGAMFGDNLSIISDTTIAATRGAGCKMNDKFKMNLLIALPAAIVTIVLYSLVGTTGALEQEYPFQLLKILPYIVVLVSAVAGVNVVLVLLGGTFFAGLVGFVMGSLNFITFCQALGDGMAGMFNLVVVALLIRGMTGIVNEYGGIKWLIDRLTARIKSRRGGEYGISALAGLVDAGLGNNTIAIIITAPLAKEIAKKQNIAPKRVASLMDIWACVAQGIIPHGGQILLACTLSGMSPVAVIGSGYYPLMLAVATIVTIQGGLLKSKEEKQGISCYSEEEDAAATL